MFPASPYNDKYKVGKYGTHDKYVMFRPVQTNSDWFQPVQTGSDRFRQVHTGSDQFQYEKQHTAKASQNIDDSDKQAGSHRYTVRHGTNLIMSDILPFSSAQHHSVSSHLSGHAHFVIVHIEVPQRSYGSRSNTDTVMWKYLHNG